MKCVRCGSAQAAVPLSYGGLCETCFTRSFEKRVRKTIRTGRLLSANDVVAIGLSGGKDSAVALHVLALLSKRLPRMRLFGVTADMGVSGYMPGVIKAARKVCDATGVEHAVVSIKDEIGVTLDEVMARARKTPNQPGACTFCGVLRRRVLNNRLRAMGATKLATGHNLDDEIQTFWMNALRGDFQRVARMGSFVGVVKTGIFVPRIKPLRDTPEEEVLAYARIHRIPYTSEACPLRGDSLRRTIGGMLDTLERRHPGSKFQLLSGVDELVPILREKYGRGRIGVCAKCGEHASGMECKTCAILHRLGLVK